MTYDFDDILITPAEMTDINSRSEVNPFYGNKLPLIAAPIKFSKGTDFLTVRPI